MLAYYSNNTFNYSKIGVITHDEYGINSNLFLKMVN